jgi:hypothetical protein
MAIGSLVASVVGVPFFFLCFVGSVGSIVGIVLGAVAISQIKGTGEKGQGLAVAGIVIGVLSMLFGTIGVVAVMNS